jgi:hypothetical protein
MFIISTSVMGRNAGFFQVVTLRKGAANWSIYTSSMLRKNSFNSCGSPVLNGIIEPVRG